jgi:hypothetical protein
MLPVPVMRLKRGNAADEMAAGRFMQWKSCGFGRHSARQPDR